MRRFKVGQVVAVRNSLKVLRIGGVWSVGEGLQPWYTEHGTDSPPYFTEAVLRPLTKRERGPEAGKERKPGL